MTDVPMQQAGSDPLERVMLGMKGYIDGEIQKVRDDFTGVLTSHVDAIHELRDLVSGLQTEVTLGLAFDGEAYQRFVVAECARLGVKPSAVMKAKLELAKTEGAETEGAETEGAEVEGEPGDDVRSPD